MPFSPSTRLPSFSEGLADTLAELMRVSTQLSQRLHPATASSLAELLRLTNSYYSNLLEGNVTRPRDIERALAEQLDEDRRTRDLQREAAAHVQVQRAIDDRYARGELSEPAAKEFICWIHRAFYDGAPEAMLRIERNDGTDYTMVPGDLREESFQDNVVGRHRPPSSSAVGGFMAYFEEQGIEASRMRLSQGGPYEPVTTSEDEFRHQNARVDIFLLDEYVRDANGNTAAK